MARRVIEGVRLVFRNFSGTEKTWNGKVINREGDRNFCMVVDKKLADELDAEDWYVKVKPPKEEGDDELIYVKVRIGDKFPPAIYQVTSRNKIKLPVESFGSLDRAYVENVDLVITQGRNTFEQNGREYHSAYLDKMYVTIKEDDLDKKYGDYDMSVDEEMPFD